MSIQYLNSPAHMHTEHMLHIGHVTLATSAGLKMSSDGVESAFSTGGEQGDKTAARKQG